MAIVKREEEAHDEETLDVMRARPVCIPKTVSKRTRIISYAKALPALPSCTGAEFLSNCLKGTTHSKKQNFKLKPYLPTLNRLFDYLDLRDSLQLSSIYQMNFFNFKINNDFSTDSL